MTPEEQARHAWSSTVWRWSASLRESPTGLVLAEWLGHPQKYLAVVSEASFRAFIVDLLFKARYEDCAAAGFSFDATSTLSGHLGGWIQIEFTPDGEHRAVFWCEPGWGGSRLWVDGQAVSCDVLDGEHPFPAPGGSGHWVDGRFLVSRVAGPADHPMQDPYAPSPRIMSLFLYDAQNRKAHVVHPRPDQRWGNPCIERHGNEVRIFANQTLDGHESTPDRVIAIDELVL